MDDVQEAIKRLTEAPPLRHVIDHCPVDALVTVDHAQAMWEYMVDLLPRVADVAMVLAELERTQTAAHEIAVAEVQAVAKLGLAEQRITELERESRRRLHWMAQKDRRIDEYAAITKPCPNAECHNGLSTLIDPLGDICGECGGVGRVAKAQMSLTQQGESLALVPFPERLGSNEETSYLGHYRVPEGLAQPIRHDESGRRFVLCWNTLYDEHPYLSWMPLDEVHKHYGAGYEPVLVGSWESEQ